MHRLTLVTSSSARLPYRFLVPTTRRSFSATTRQSDDSSTSGRFHRSDFQSQGFTGYYDPSEPTIGPLGDASNIGAPNITPKVLKQYLDQYVIGQERAKKVLSVAVYNHYQRVQEIQRREEEYEELLAQQARRAIAGRHPVEDEFPGQQPTVTLSGHSSSTYIPAPLPDKSDLNIEKSNVLLLGPSGVGKTLMTKTLARILDVPFSISDCTPFTQAGYIGEDADVCVQRLLAAANYDVARAERGIICLDEIDKIATAKVSHGKDVSGEGVQQALLKIIEGTVVQVHAKQEKGSTPGAPSASGPSTGGGRMSNTVPTGGIGPGNTLGSLGQGHGQQQPGPQKGDVYNVDTSNILFICTGAFVGLHKLIMDRIAKGSIGFGARVSSAPSSSDTNDPTIRAGVNAENDELFRKNLPFFTAPNDTFAPAAANPSTNTPSTTPASDQTSSSAEARARQRMQEEDADPPTYNTLDLATPADLQKYGLIPEFIGRVPVTCSLAQLSLAALVRVLTEPRNSLLSQYTQLFALSGIELRFTAPALRQVARAAQDMGTGARGLRTVMERLLGEAMFEAPGSGVRYCLVTDKAARKQEAVVLLGRGMQGQFEALIEREEHEWAVRRGLKSETQAQETFSQYRERAKVAGAGGAF